MRKCIILSFFLLTGCCSLHENYTEDCESCYKVRKDLRGMLKAFMSGMADDKSELGRAAAGAVAIFNEREAHDQEFNE